MSDNKEIVKELRNLDKTMKGIDDTLKEINLSLAILAGRRSIEERRDSVSLLIPSFMDKKELKNGPEC